MNSTLVLNIIRFIVIYLFQVFILFNVNIIEDINFYLYPILILLLPLRISHGLMLGIAFVTGALVGINYNAAGEHAAATTLLAFLRPTILAFLEPRGGYTPKHAATRSHFGLTWVFQYSAILLAIHILALSFLETLSFNFTTVIKFIFNTTIAVIMVMLYQLLFNPKE